MNDELKVGISDMKMTIGQGVIATYALGSCVGVTFYDPKIKLGAMVHVLLPERKNKKDENVYKYADTGISETVRRLAGWGMDKRRTVVKIAGGAQMFKGTTGFEDIGQRNINAVRAQLESHGMKVAGESVGGNHARTMRLNMVTGEVTVSTFGQPAVVI